jgi:hypothetical protein
LLIISQQLLNGGGEGSQNEINEEGSLDNR